MTERASHWVIVAPLLGVVACAKVWGFDDLTLGPDNGSPDATTPGDDQAAGSEGGGSDDGAAEGAVDIEDSGDSGDARSEGDGGDGGGSTGEGGGGDAGDAGTLAAYCATHCPNGCCDSSNLCVNKLTTASCGIGGAACVDCSKTVTTCTPILSGPCCGATSGQCACTTAGVCNKN